MFLWSTGFIGSKLGAPYAEPLTFLSWRYLVAVALLLGAALLTRAAWPSTPRAAGHAAVAGLLVQGAYLSGVFCGVARGMPLATVSLIVGLQPILTAMAAGLEAWPSGEHLIEADQPIALMRQRLRELLQLMEIPNL